MRIAFVCPGLEPGRDGVGDYTRRLAAECHSQGHATTVLSLNDAHISKKLQESQEGDGRAVPVLRLPRTMPWSERAVESRRWLAAFKPDCISLQYVAFGYHPKGLCFGLGKHLSAMSPKASWHFMMHELWLGMGEKSSVKDRIWGGMQKLIFLDLMRRIKPRVVHTQAEAYRITLSREKINSSILPLFGNIPYVEGDGWNGLLEPLVTEALGDRADRSKLYLAGVFGGVHPQWSAETCINAIFPLTQTFQRRLVLVFVGRSHLTGQAIQQLKLALKTRADVVVAGERTPAEISSILQTLDLGLATTPIQVIQKSGSVAAMLEHGLSVLVIRDDWRLRGSEAHSQELPFPLFSLGQFALLKTLPRRDTRLAGDNSVKRVAGQFIEAINARSN